MQSHANQTAVDINNKWTEEKKMSNYLTITTIKNYKMQGIDKVRPLHFQWCRV